MKKIAILVITIIQSLILTSTPSWALHYNNEADGETMHQRACTDTFQATGWIYVKYEDGSFQWGTATLIAPDIILTAAHIIGGSGQILKTIDTLCFQPICSIDQNTCPLMQKPKNAWIHPHYINNLSINDIAIVQLAKPLNHIQPAELQEILPPDLRSAYVTVVGYGPSNEPSNNDYIKRRAADMEIMHQPDMSILLTQNHFGYIDFNNPKYSGALVPGDSGGPALIQIHGEPFPRILGISIFTTPARGLPSHLGMHTFVSIPDHYPWIESVLKSCNIEATSSQDLDYLDTKRNKKTMTSTSPSPYIKSISLTTSQQGYDLFQSLCNYGSKSAKAFYRALESLSDEALKQIYQYIESNEE